QKKEKEKKEKGKARSKSHVAQDDIPESETDSTAAAMYNDVKISKNSEWALSAYFVSEPNPKGHLLVDSGASKTMVPYVHWFDPKSLVYFNKPHRIGFSNNSEVFAITKGTILLKMKTTKHHLTDILLAPDL
ncbi:hypothetical protein FIBSPDRAFT_686853, partial [Athelia psychrophila]